MSDKKFSVLVMRDDSSVRRMRFHPFIFKTGIYFLILLVFCAVVSLYAGIHFWKQNRFLSSEMKQMQRTLTAQQMELKRLRNIELLLEEDNNEDMTSIVVASGEKQANQTEEPPINLKKILGSIDKRILIANNVQVRLARESMNITFDINKLNQDDKEIIKGDVKLHLVSINGDLHRLDSEKEMFFELRRMKQYRVRVAIPDSYSKDDIFGIRITINHPQHEPVFSETFPLSDVLL
jgi:cell division protein FtsL